MNRHKRKRERLKRVSVVHSQLCDQSRLCRISNNAATPTSKLPISLSLSLSHTLCLSLSLIHSVSLSYTPSLSHSGKLISQWERDTLTISNFKLCRAHLLTFNLLRVLFSLSLSHPRTQSPIHSFSFSNLLPVLNVVVVQMRIWGFKFDAMENWKIVQMNCTTRAW